MARKKQQKKILKKYKGKYVTADSIGHLLEDKIESTLVVYIVLVFSEIFFGEFFENVVER